MQGEYDRRPAISDRGIKQCPWCGEELDPTDTGVTLDGRESTVAALAPVNFRGSAGVRIYHPRCKRKRELIRRRVENQRLTAFA